MRATLLEGERCQRAANSGMAEMSTTKWWHPVAVPILRALTSVFNSLARCANNHPRAIVEFVLMIGAATSVLMGTALVYLIWLII
jgi:hypothetical protein